METSPLSKLLVSLITAAGITLGAAPTFSATFTVTNTGATGSGSLFDAIADANAAPGADTIEFDIASGPFVITPVALPALTEEVLIDGYSQPGAMPNLAAPGAGTSMVVVIEIDASALPFGAAALTISADKCTIRGLSIYHCDAAAIRIIGNVKGNRVEGNILGTDNLGVVLPGNDIGVEIAGAHDNWVGGETPDTRNWIVGEVGGGFPGRYGVHIHDPGAQGNRIWNNQFGTDRAGTNELGYFTEAAVYIENAGENEIGGASDIHRNYLVGSIGHGVSVVGGSGNLIRGNFIGTGMTGTENLGNAMAGVHLASSSNIVGGTLSGEGNLIRFNRGYGVGVESGTDNAILGNSILNNSAVAGSGLAIDLAMDGVTHNDAWDWDTGPNDLRNSPVIASATISGIDDLSVSGHLFTGAYADFRIEFFTVNACDPSGYGEGAIYLGYVDVTTNAAGLATIYFSLASSGLDDTDEITATATRLLGGGATLGSTSEFSECTDVVSGPLAFVAVMTAPPSGLFDSIAIEVEISCMGPGEAINVVGSIGESLEPFSSCVTSADISTDVDYGTIVEGGSSTGAGPHIIDMSNCSAQNLVVPFTVSYDDPQTLQRHSIVFTIILDVSDTVAIISAVALPEVNGIASRVHAMNENGWSPGYATGEILLPGDVWRPAVWTRSGSQWTRELLPPFLASKRANVLGITGEQNNDITGEQNNDIFAVGFAVDAADDRNGALWIKDGSNPWVLQLLPSPTGQPYEANSIIETSEGIYVGGSTTSSGVETGVLWYYDYDLASWVNSILCHDDGDQITYLSMPDMEEMSLDITGEQNNDIVAMGRRTILGGLPAIAVVVDGEAPGNPIYIDMPMLPGLVGGEVQAGDPTTSMFAGVVVDNDSRRHIMTWPEANGTWAAVLLPDPVQNMVSATVTGIGGQQGAYRVIVGHATNSAGTVPFIYRENSNGDWIPSVPLYEGDGLRAHRITGVDKKGRMIAQGLVPVGGAMSNDFSTASAPADSAHAMYMFSDTPTGVVTPPSGSSPSPLQVNAYPNPFNPSVTIAFTAPQSARTVVKVYDVSGTLVTTLLDKQMPAGEHSLTWNGTNSNGAGVATGVYFVRVQTSEQAATRKLVLLK